MFEQEKGPSKSFRHPLAVIPFVRLAALQDKSGSSVREFRRKRGSRHSATRCTNHDHSIDTEVTQ